MIGALRVMGMGAAVLVGLAGCSDDSGGASPGAAAGSAGASAGSAGSMSGGGAAGAAAGAAGSGTSGTVGNAGSGGKAGAGPTEEGCVPSKVAPEMAAGATVLLDRPNTQPLRVVQASAEHVFVGTSLGIERVSKLGGAAELILADDGPPNFRLGGDTLYFIREGALYSVPSTATEGTATLVAADIGVNEPNDNLLTIDAGYAYLWQRATEAITRLELATGEVTPLLTGSSNRAWQIYDGFMYYAADFGRLMRVPLTGGDAELVSTESEDIWSFTTGEPATFYGTYGAIYRSAKPQRVPLLSMPRVYIERIEIHGDRLVFSGGSVGWVKLDGSACQTIGLGPEYDEWQLDDENAYVAGSYTLYKIPL